MISIFLIPKLENDNIRNKNYNLKSLMNTDAKILMKILEAKENIV